jgi:hypothetical protein
MSRLHHISTIPLSLQEGDPPVIALAVALPPRVKLKSAPVLFSTHNYFTGTTTGVPNTPPLWKTW